MQTYKSTYSYISAILLAFFLTFATVANAIAKDPPPSTEAEGTSTLPATTPQDTTPTPELFPTTIYETPLPPTVTPELSTSTAIPTSTPSLSPEPTFFPPTSTFEQEEIRATVTYLPTQTPTPTTPTLPDIQAQLPENTTVQILVDGQIEPLVTQQAENALLQGDPIWCPEGVPPIPGIGGCTGSYLTFEDLLTDFYSSNIPEPSTHGIIWIMDGTDLSTNSLFIDGPTFTTWRNFRLTLQGGWDGSAAGTIIGNSTFTESISVFDWLAPVFVNDISVDGATANGLEIITTDSVSLQNISTTGNSNSGIYVEAGNGVTLQGIISTNNTNNGIEIYSTGDVLLNGTNILSDNTLGSGAYIDAIGNVDVNDLTANNNGATGLEIISTGSVTIDGITQFNLNSLNGLYVEASGDIYAEDLTANNNGLNGSTLISTSGSLDLIGVNVFSNNGVDGLQAQTDIDIYIENLTAENNGNQGADLFSLGNISLIGTNIFNDNIAGNGLYAESSGNIDIQNLSAIGNGNNGAELIANLNVTLTGLNLFDLNALDGLYIEADSTNLENITATNNFGNGASLIVTDSINITGSNIFNSNLSSGLYADSGGDINLESITANANSINGADLTTTQSLFITGTNVFNSNNNSGLSVFADGGIAVENLTANSNGTGGVFGIGAEFYTLGNFTLTGINNFNDNNNSGLYVDADGTTIVENIIANNNGVGGYGNGAEFYTISTFTLTGTNEFLNNNNSGLYVDADGSITAENITANDNGVGGVYGHGLEFYSQDAVTLTGSNVFNNNYLSGFYIEAIDDIFVDTASAENNGANGAYLSTNGSVAMVCGVFNGNASYEINAILPNGSLTLFGVDFGGNPSFNIGGVDKSQLNLISNGCFTYPEPISGGLIEGESEFGIRYLYKADGKTFELDCAKYSGTYLQLINGDALLVPCPIVDSVRLSTLNGLNLPFPIFNRNYISGMDIYITQNGRLLSSIEQDNVIWYRNLENPETAGYEAAYYDGSNWIDVTYQITPFMTMFFLLPEDMKGKDLAILYWNNTEWIELIPGEHLGNGRIIRNIGFSPNGNYFQAEVNFIGQFVLVEK